MGKQYRGCSKLYYATVTEAADGSLTFGTPKPIIGVKAISREINAASEQIWADNTLQEESYAGTQVTRSFDTLKLDGATEAELLGKTEITVGTRKGYSTPPTGATRPYLAFGYALHDGDPDLPCELVWGFKGKVNSITKNSATIDAGTGSEGQTIEITFVAPKKAWSTTSKSELDFAFNDNVTATDVTKFFTAVVTPDTAATALA